MHNGAQCRKCGAWAMVGPRYCPTCPQGADEHLHYTCSVCGFRAAEPTRDAQPAEVRG